MNTQETFVFNPDEWKTPNTWGNNFDFPPNKPGIYMIVKPIVDVKNLTVSFDILYVGSSRNLHKRYSNHEVLDKAKDEYGYVQFYFIEKENHFEEEKKLIKIFQPKYNVQWR